MFFLAAAHAVTWLFFNKCVYLQQKSTTYTTTYIIYTTLHTLTAIGSLGDLQTTYNTLIHYLQNSNYVAYGESTATTKQKNIIAVYSIDTIKKSGVMIGTVS